MRACDDKKCGKLLQKEDDEPADGVKAYTGTVKASDRQQVMPRVVCRHRLAQCVCFSMLFLVVHAVKPAFAL